MTQAKVNGTSNAETMTADELKRHVDDQVDSCSTLEMEVDNLQVTDRWFFGERIDAGVPVDDSFSPDQRFSHPKALRHRYRFHCRLWFNVDLREWVYMDAAASFRRMADFLLQQAAKCDELAADEQETYGRRAMKAVQAEKVPA